MNQQYNHIVFWKRNKIVLWLSLILMFGLSLRLYNLGSHNLWFDEGATLVFVNQLSLYGQSYNFTFPSLLSRNLYYILLKILVICFGESEFVLRSLSMIFGLLSISLIYKLGNELFNSRVGLSSAFILSISPMHIWYSQEARGYSLSIVLAMLMVYFFILALKKNRFLWWVSFIVSSILAMYTNYFCFYIIIIASALLFLVRRYKYLLKWALTSFCVIWVALLPEISNFIEQIIRLKDNSWIPNLHLSSIVITFENFNVGYNATPNIYFFTFIIFSLLFILGLQRWWQEKREELISLILFLFIPIISTFLISQIIHIYLDRQLMLFSPFYYIIIAAGLTKIKLPIIKIATYLSISVPILFCLYNYFSYRMPLPQYHHIGVHVKKPVKPAADYINERFMQGDAVGFSEPSSVVLFYYIPKLIREKIDIFSFVIKSKMDTYWKRMGERSGEYGVYIGMRKGRRIPFGHIVILDKGGFYKIPEEDDFKRLWLIYSSWARDGILDPHAQAVREWMKVNYLLVDTKEFYGIFVDLYAKK